MPLRAVAIALAITAQPCEPAWWPLGDGLNGRVRSLAVFDDGSGPALYAGGDFTTAGAHAAGRLARWDGALWSPVGAGVGANNTVQTLQVFDDGSGPALFAFGSFTSVDGVSAAHAARWDGHKWSQAGDGLPGYTGSAQVFDDGDGPALYVGGYHIENHIVSYAARLDGSSWTILSGLKGSWISDL